MDTYEKKYKEALERARQIHSKTEFDYEKGMMEEIFPELKESEDEKIRKELITFIKNVIEVVVIMTTISGLLGLKSKGSQQS